MSYALNFPILKSLGLTETESILYELLLEMGPQLARDLVRPSGLTRGNVYNVLMQLNDKGFVTIAKGKQQHFQAVDPSELRRLLELQTEQIRRLDTEFTSTLPKLISKYTLSTNRPAIQTFEGYDGYKAAIDDLLQTSTEILTYIDTEALVGPLTKLDSYFEKQRVTKGIQNRIIVTDTPNTREIFKHPLKLQQIAFLSNFPSGFKTALDIGDRTVTYFSLTDGKDIAVSITHPAMCDMHRQQFEFLWAQAARAETPRETRRATGGTSNTK